MRDKSRNILKLTKSLFKCRNLTYQEPKAEKHTLNHHSQPPQVTPHPGRTELETGSGESLPTSLHGFSCQAQTSDDSASFSPALSRFEGDGEDIFYISTITENYEEALEALIGIQNSAIKLNQTSPAVALRWSSAGRDAAVLSPHLTIQESKN